MKLNGIELTTPNEVVIPIIRSTGPIYFVAKAVHNYDEYDKMADKVYGEMTSLLPGVVECINRLKDNGFKIAVASSPS